MLEDEFEDEESDQVLDQVLDEIGLDLNTSVRHTNTPHDTRHAAALMSGGLGAVVDQEPSDRVTGPVRKRGRSSRSGDEEASRRVGVQCPFLFLLQCGPGTTICTYVTLPRAHSTSSSSRLSHTTSPSCCHFIESFICFSLFIIICFDLIYS